MGDLWLVCIFFEITYISRSRCQRCSVKKKFVSFKLQIWATLKGAALKKLQATLLKKRLWLRYFPVNFAKFLRTPFFLQNTSGVCFCALEKQPKNEENEISDHNRQVKIIIPYFCFVMKLWMLAPAFLFGLWFLLI